MEGIYEAVVETSCGTFRAHLREPRLIVILEDNVDGIADVIHLHPNETSAAAPENMPITLKWWVLENVRGVPILNSYLNLR